MRALACAARPNSGHEYAPHPAPNPTTFPLAEMSPTAETTIGVNRYTRVSDDAHSSWSMRSPLFAHQLCELPNCPSSTLSRLTVSAPVAPPTTLPSPAHSEGVTVVPGHPQTTMSNGNLIHTHSKEKIGPIVQKRPSENDASTHGEDKRPRTSDGQETAVAAPVILPQYTGTLDPQACYALRRSFTESCDDWKAIPAHFRFGLLENAMSDKDSQDLVFIVINQISCLSLVDPKSFPQAVRIIPNLPKALETLDYLVTPAHMLTPRVRHFFAYYPGPLNQLLKDFPQYEGALGEAVSFLSSLAIQLPVLMYDSSNNGVPPLAEELSHRLNLKSSMLQRVVFRSIVRAIWDPVSEDMVSSAEVAFKDSQTALKLYAAGQITRSIFCKDMRGFAAVLLHNRDVVKVGQMNRPVGCQLRQDGSPNARPGQTQNLPQVNSDFPWPSQLQASQSPAINRATPLATVTPVMPNHQGIALQMNAQTVGSRPIAPGDNNAGPLRHLLPAKPWPPTSGMNHSAAQPILAIGRTPPLQLAQSLGQSPPSCATQTLPNTIQSGQQNSGVTLKRLSLLPPRYPEVGWQANQFDVPEPWSTALHEAWLRSPVLTTLAQQKLLGRMYLYVDRHAMSPKQLSSERLSQTWTFDLSEEEFSRRTKDICTLAGRPYRQLTVDSQFYRFRCIEGAESSESSCLIASDTSWPFNVYFTLNNVPLHPRRKLHHGKDLSIDVTSMLHKGRNVINMSSNRGPEEGPLNHVICVEMVKLELHNRIMDNCLKNVTAADVIKRSMISSLSSGTRERDACDTRNDNDMAIHGNKDDDITILSNTLTLSLIDPILATKIWDVPVRSKACPHREAFDLETFLITRRYECPYTQTLKSAPFDPKDVLASNCLVHADEWRCPICGADARPQMLFVDGWLQEVKEELAANDTLDAKAIEVHMDGSWHVKLTAQSRLQTAPTSGNVTTNNIATTHFTSSIAEKRVEIEVIEILDD